MSIKWTANRSESGILRKSEFKEKKEELFVFGYSCKLFRDNEKALHIDQGKHLIPWMGDETLKIDSCGEERRRRGAPGAAYRYGDDPRWYDARGALHDLSTLEAPPGGYDWRVELTRMEQDVEQLCDEERYRALHTDEDEEEMYKEEELKRLHAAGYGQVGFNYDAPQEPEQASQPTEVDEPFEPTETFKALLPSDILLPEGIKQNVIIEKTAKFIAAQGVQMEILIKAKQGDNPQFQFLNKDSPLNPYYSALITLIKADKWPEKEPEVVEEKPPETEEYLHPSLASTIIELAPSIPSIQYRASADCDYRMLVCKMRGEPTLDEACAPELAPGEEPPPGTGPLPPRPAAIARAPVMYDRRPRTPKEAPATPPAPVVQYQQPPTYYAPPATAPAPVAPRASTGLSLMRNYNTDDDTDDESDGNSSTESKETIATPPEDVQAVIEKMAEYVARNGDEFAAIVRAKSDPRFAFLEPASQHHAYYARLVQRKRAAPARDDARAAAPVSFSIKKLKEPDPILPKPALPYESSSEDESEKTDKPEEPKEPPKTPTNPISVPSVPTVCVYKIENAVTEVAALKPIETYKPISKAVLEAKDAPVANNTPVKPIQQPVKTVSPVKEVKDVKEVKELPPEEIKPQEKVKERDSPKRDKRKHKERKKEYRSKSESREMKRSERSEDREKRRDKDGEKERKRTRPSKEDVEPEIISLVDTTDDLIDLTGDQSDSKSGEVESEADRAKQLERRRRAAEFLRRVGVDPAAAALPASSLASAMVDTLESIRKKKAEDEKRRRREKRRHREKYEYEDGAEKSQNAHRKSKRRKHKSSDENEESDYDVQKTLKKKKKKEKKQAKSKKKRRRSASPGAPLEPLSVDLARTLRGLRHASPEPTLLPEPDSMGVEMDYDEGSRRERKRKKEEREYSEGEWSSDSEQDSGSSHSAVDE